MTVFISLHFILNFIDMILIHLNFDKTLNCIRSVRLNNLKVF